MQRRQAQLTIAFSPTFKRQPAWGVPLDASEITVAHPATARGNSTANYVETEETVEEVYDCTGEDFLIERVTGRFSRLTIEFEADPDLLAGWEALTYGVASTPSGGTNEIQTLTGAGITGGTYQARWTNDYDMQISAAIPFNANAAAIQAALEAMTNIGAGNVLVGGGPVNAAPVTAQFRAALANRPLAALEILSALDPGGSIAVARTTPGVGRTHQISRLGVGLYVLPWTTLYVGFRGSDRDPLICEDVVVASIRCRGTSREVVTVTVTLLMKTPTAHAVGFSMPACLDIEPIRFGDCDALLEGESLFAANGARWGNGSGIAPWRDFEYGFDNNPATGASAFTTQGIDIGRLERADKRPSYINLGIFGEEDDPVWVAARQQEPRYVTSLDLRLGPVGNNVLVRVPQGIFKLDNPPIRFEGDLNESTLRTIMRPKKVRGNSSSPSNVVATVGQDTAFLISA